MDFWELLYFVGFIGMLSMLIIKFIRIWDIAGKKESYSDEERSNINKWNWILFILNLVTFGVVWFTFMYKFDENLLIPLTRLVTGMFAINSLLFVIEFFFTLGAQGYATSQGWDTKNLNWKF